MDIPAADPWHRQFRWQQHPPEGTSRLKLTISANHHLSCGRSMRPISTGEKSTLDTNHVKVHRQSPFPLKE